MFMVAHYQYYFNIQRQQQTGQQQQLHHSQQLKEGEIQKMGTVPNKGVAFGGMEMSVNDDDGQLITPTGEHNMHATFLNEYKQMRLEAMAATVIQVISLLSSIIYQSSNGQSSNEQSSQKQPSFLFGILPAAV